MATNEGRKTFVASAAIEPYRVLQLAAGKVLHNVEASGALVVLGFSEYPAAVGDDINVDMTNLPGTREVTASGAIDAGADAYAADNGMVQALPAAAGTYRLIGTNIFAAVDGGVAEIMPVSAKITKVVT